MCNVLQLSFILLPEEGCGPAEGSVPDPGPGLSLPGPSRTVQPWHGCLHGLRDASK